MKKAAMFFQIFTIAMCFALIFTECTPIASDGEENPSNPGGGSSSGGTPQNVTLTFVLDGGKIGGATTYSLTGKTGDAITQPANPVKDRFVFTKWNPDLPAKFPASSTTYTAQYKNYISGMSIDEAIAKINALGANETLDVVLGSDTTQAVFKNKYAELYTALKNCQGKVNLDMSEADVTSIGGWGAFYGCSSLASVIIPDSVTSIFGESFSGCSSLASVTIGNGVTSIGNEAFSGCSSLASVTIGNGVTGIGISAFRYCSSLASVVIPDSVRSFGEYAFEGCSKLDKINYAGTKDDWNTKITRFGSDWKSRRAPAAGVTCSDGKTYKFVGSSSSAADSKLGDPL